MKSTLALFIVLLIISCSAEEKKSKKENTPNEEVKLNSTEKETVKEIPEGFVEGVAADNSFSILMPVDGNVTTEKIETELFDGTYKLVMVFGSPKDMTDTSNLFQSAMVYKIDLTESKINRKKAIDDVIKSTAFVFNNHVIENRETISRDGRSIETLTAIDNQSGFKRRAEVFLEGDALFVLMISPYENGEGSEKIPVFFESFKIME